MPRRDCGARGGCEDEQLDLKLGPDVAVGDNVGCAASGHTISESDAA
jgi:hypothetical protein